MPFLSIVIAASLLVKQDIPKGVVYKKTSDGWSKYNDGSWNPVQPPTNSKNNTQQNLSGQTRQSSQQNLSGQTRQNSQQNLSGETRQSSQQNLSGETRQNSQQNLSGATERGAGFRQGSSGESAGGFRQGGSGGGRASNFVHFGSWRPWVGLRQILFETLAIL